MIKLKPESLNLNFQSSKYRHAYKIFNKDTILDLSEENFLEILESDQLEVVDELQVFNAVLKYNSLKLFIISSFGGEFLKLFKLL